MTARKGSEAEMEEPEEEPEKPKKKRAMKSAPINTVEGGTRYGIKEKIFQDFTGYMLDDKGKRIVMVAAYVKE